MSETIEDHYWHASDGAQLFYRAVGDEKARTVILVHGLFSDSNVNWIKYGHAAKVAAAGFRVVMPDLRAHGRSAASHDPAAYPMGILGRDLEELVAHLGLADGEYDLGGFSLGARTTAQAIGEGLKPGKAMLMGMGIDGLRGWEKRQAFFIHAIDNADGAKRGEPHFMAVSFMKTMGIDPIAARLLLPTSSDARPEWFDAFTMPTAIICGTEDGDNGSAAALADALPDAVHIEIPGTHMSSVTRPELGAAIADWLAKP